MLSDIDSRCAGHSPEYRLICDERHGCKRHTDPVASLLRIQALIEGAFVTAIKQCPFYIEDDE